MRLKLVIEDWIYLSNKIAKNTDKKYMNNSNQKATSLQTLLVSSGREKENLTKRCKIKGRKQKHRYLEKKSNC